MITRTKKPDDVVLDAAVLRPGGLYSLAVLPAFVQFTVNGQVYETVTHPPYATAAMNKSYVKKRTVLNRATLQGEELSMSDVVRVRTFT